MKTIEDARLLAKTMVAIGTMAGKDTTAIITDMNEPLGNAVGNILEVQEAVECLHGQGEARLMEVSKTLACYMLLAAKKAATKAAAADLIEDAIASGKALQKMKEFVSAQGGDISCIDHFDHFDKASLMVEVSGADLMQYHGQTGDAVYLAACDNPEIGMTSLI